VTRRLATVAACVDGTATKSKRKINPMNETSKCFPLQIFNMALNLLK